MKMSTFFSLILMVLPTASLRAISLVHDMALWQCSSIFK